MIIPEKTSVNATVLLIAVLCWNTALGQSAAADTTKPLPGPKAHKRQWGTPVNGVAISLTTTATRVPPVDKIFVEAAWKNVGNRTALFPETNNFLEDFRFRVIMPNGKAAPLTEWGKRMRESLARRGQYGSLEPGKEDVEQHGLGRLFDFSLEGKYTISLERTVEKDDGSNAAAASSCKLEITVDGSLWGGGGQREDKGAIHQIQVK